MDIALFIEQRINREYVIWNLVPHTPPSPAVEYDSVHSVLGHWSMFHY